MTAPVLLVVEQLRRPTPGGVGRYAASLLDGLRVARAPVAGLVASRHRGHGEDPLARWGFPVMASLLPGPALVRLWDAALLASPAGAPVVHAVSLAAPPPRRQEGRRQALVVTVHDLAWRDLPDATTPRGRRWHEAALGRALARADAFVVPSQPVAAALAGAGAEPARVHVIGHGVDHLPPPDHQGAAALLERLGVTGGYLLAAGTLEPRKNLARLAAAYDQARPRLGADWPLVVVGPPGWGDAGLSLRDGAPTQGAAGAVVAAGAVTDGVLAALYAGARAFCYVPLAEGFGLPPVEAMACGAPVVASTAVPSVEPLAGAEAPALRVDPSSAPAIADALVTASGDDAVRTALIARGRQHVAGRTWRQSAQAHLDLWASVGAP